MPPPSALIAAVVRYERVASPVMRLQMLAPLFESRPSPFEMRDTISVASTGLLEAIRCWRSRSYQRKAGIPSLLPCRIPAWLADVIDGRIASQRDSLWVPSRTRPAMRVDRPGAHPAGQDRMGEPVDLDDHEARLVRVALRALDHQPLDQEPVVRAAGVDAEDRRQDRVDDRVDERPDQRGRERVDMDARRELGDDEERRRSGGRGRGSRRGSARSAPRGRARRVGRPR